MKLTKIKWLNRFSDPETEFVTSVAQRTYYGGAQLRLPSDVIIEKYPGNANAKAAISKAIAALTGETVDSVQAVINGDLEFFRKQRLRFSEVVDNIATSLGFAVEDFYPQLPLNDKDVKDFVAMISGADGRGSYTPVGACGADLPDIENLLSDQTYIKTKMLFSTLSNLDKHIIDGTE